MKTQWMIETHGDPLGAVRKFVRDVWQQAKLEGMLVPMDGDGRAKSTLRLVPDPEQLDQLNPFKPLMTANAARLMPMMVREHPEKRYGVVLRPCEMRALIEMVKHDSFSLDSLLTICVDCLSTLPADDYRWRAERKGSAAGLTQEVLQFARQGGIVPYRYRSACQMCFSSKACEADLNIGVLGLPVRLYILVTARNEAVARQFQLNVIPDKADFIPADLALIEQREHLLAKLAERQQRTRERVLSSLSEHLPADVDEIVKMFDVCGSCQACMEACPICSVDFPRRGADGKYLYHDLARWLISCAGCGMCDQACPHQLPLSAIFGRIREQLAETAQYRSGHRLEEPLPLQSTDFVVQAEVE